MKNVFKVVLLSLLLLSIILISIYNLNAQVFSPWEIEKLVGKKAPEFTVKNLSGKSVPLSAFKGKPILLNFWATWCPYCREERPSLNSLYREYKDRGLVIISVSTDRSPQKVRAYLERIPMNFIILMDNDSKAARLYGVYSLPTNFLIDREGIIKHKFMGLRNWMDSGSKKFIDGLLKE